LLQELATGVKEFYAGEEKEDIAMNMMQNHSD
jgi:hypothetical protein